MPQTRCDLFDCQYRLWKEGGQSYMKCSYCGGVRAVTVEDVQDLPDFDDRPYEPKHYDYDDLWNRLR